MDFKTVLTFLTVLVFEEETFLVVLGEINFLEYSIVDMLGRTVYQASVQNPTGKISIGQNVDDEKDESPDSVIDAWDLALSSPFSQIKKYNDYLSEASKFGTHQGVKGLEYPRVMVILDDEESRGFLFSYDKLFGSKELSATDKKNILSAKK